MSKYFHVSTYYNKLKNPPSKIENLTDIIIWYNVDIEYLEGLELVPKLKYLNCSNNRIEKLPELPKKLTTLICSSNKLQHLPELPKTLTYLKCDDNLLHELPEIPDGMVKLLCDSNYLKELPDLKNISVFSGRNNHYIHKYKLNDINTLKHQIKSILKKEKIDDIVFNINFEKNFKQMVEELKKKCT